MHLCFSHGTSQKKWLYNSVHSVLLAQQSAILVHDNYFEGNKNRVVGSTNMNEQSSRSHAIFSSTIECSELGPDGQQHVKVGKLHLVDLAVSNPGTRYY